MRPVARDEWAYPLRVWDKSGSVLRRVLIEGVNLHRMVYSRTATGVLFISVPTSGVLIRGFPSISQQAIIPSSP